LWAEQAVFTSLVRRGRAGYHLVSRSRGIAAADAQALARWAPSHGSLIVDGCNQTSVNFHALPSGRFALSRTCAGPPEYSGRGGQQLYTHFLILEEAAPQAFGFNPVSIYRDAIALGHFLFQPDPSEILETVTLSRLHLARDAVAWSARATELGLPSLDRLQWQLQAGHPLRFAYSGDRIELAECLTGLLAPEVVAATSFSTSLVPSSDRPFVLSLVNGTQDT
jgi:hypothetical protein